MKTPIGNTLSSWSSSANVKRHGKPHKQHFSLCYRLHKKTSEKTKTEAFLLAFVIPTSRVCVCLISFEYYCAVTRLGLKLAWNARLCALGRGLLVRKCVYLASRPQQLCSRATQVRKFDMDSILNLTEQVTSVCPMPVIDRWTIGKKGCQHTRSTIRTVKCRPYSVLLVTHEIH